MEGDEVQFAFHSFKPRIWGKEESEEEWAGPEGRRCAFIFMRGSIEMYKKTLFVYSYAINFVCMCMYVFSLPTRNTRNVGKGQGMWVKGQRVRVYKVI